MTDLDTLLDALARVCVGQLEHMAQPCCADHHHFFGWVRCNCGQVRLG